MGWLDTIGQLLSPAVQTIATIGGTVVSAAQGAVQQGQSIVANTIATHGGTVSPVQQTISIPQQTINMGALPSVGATANLPKPFISNLATSPAAAAPFGTNYYVPHGDRTQTELNNAKAAIDAKSGEVAFYQQAINPYTGKPRTGAYAGGIDIGGGSRAALQSGMFSAAPLTPDVRTQAVPTTFASTANVAQAKEVLANPELFSRLGAEVYGGTVQRLDASKTVQSTGAIYGRFPEASGNLANLVSPQGANLSKEDYPGSKIPWTLPEGAPSISYMSDKGLQGAAPSPFKPFAEVTAPSPIAPAVSLPAGLPAPFKSTPTTLPPAEFDSSKGFLGGLFPDVSQSRIGAYFEANKSKPLQAAASLLASGAVSAKSSFEGASREFGDFLTFGKTGAILPKQSDATAENPYGEWSKFGSGSGRVVRAGLGVTKPQIDAYGETLKDQPGIMGDVNRVGYGALSFMADRPTSLATATLAGGAMLFGGEAVGAGIKAIAPGTAVAGTAANYAYRGVQAGIGAGLFIGLAGGITDMGRAGKEQSEINLGKAIPILGAMALGGISASRVSGRMRATSFDTGADLRGGTEWKPLTKSQQPNFGTEVPEGALPPLEKYRPQEPAPAAPKIIKADFTLLPDDGATPTSGFGKTEPPSTYVQQKRIAAPAGVETRGFASQAESTKAAQDYASLFSQAAEPARATTVVPKSTAKAIVDMNSIIGSITPEATQVATVAKPRALAIASAGDFGTQASLPAGTSFRGLTEGIKPAGLLGTGEFSRIQSGQRTAPSGTIALESPKLPYDVRMKIFADEKATMLYNREAEVYSLYRGDTGEKIYTTTGTINKVSPEWDIVAERTAKLPKGTPLVESHGHPSGSSFSTQDIARNQAGAHITRVIGANPRKGVSTDIGAGVFRRISEMSTWDLSEPFPVVSKNLQGRIKTKVDSAMVEGTRPQSPSPYDYQATLMQETAARAGLKYTSTPVRPPYEVVKAPKTSVADFMRDVMGEGKPSKGGELQEELIRNPSEYLKTHAAEVKAQRAEAARPNVKMETIKAQRAATLGKFAERGGNLIEEEMKPVAPMRQRQGGIYGTHGKNVAATPAIAKEMGGFTSSWAEPQPQTESYDAEIQFKKSWERKHAEPKRAPFTLKTEQEVNAAKAGTAVSTRRAPTELAGVGGQKQTGMSTGRAIGSLSAKFGRESLALPSQKKIGELAPFTRKRGELAPTQESKKAPRPIEKEMELTKFRDKSQELTRFKPEDRTITLTTTRPKTLDIFKPAKTEITGYRTPYPTERQRPRNEPKPVPVYRYVPEPRPPTPEPKPTPTFEPTTPVPKPIIPIIPSLGGIGSSGGGGGGAGAGGLFGRAHREKINIASSLASFAGSFAAPRKGKRGR